MTSHAISYLPFLQTLYKNAKAAIFILDTNLCIAHANPFALAFFDGANLPQTKSARDLFPQIPFPEPGNAAFSASTANGGWNETTEYINAAGSVFTLQLHVVETTDDTGNCIGYVLTAHPKMPQLFQEDLNAYKERLHSMLQATTSGFYLVDASYRLLLFNNAAQILHRKLFGAELYEGDNLLTHIAPERKGIVQNSIDTAFGGIVREYDVVYNSPVKRNMRLRYSPAYGTHQNLLGVCVTFEDVTDVKSLEGEILLREKKFLNVFNFSGIGIALVSPKGKWLDVNPALTNLIGYTKEELLQRTFQEITHPADLDADMAFVQKMLAKEIDTYQMEKRYFHKNGSIIWVILKVSLVWNSDDTPNFFISQIIDITATKALIKELETKNRALDFAAQDLEYKIEQLEEFTHMVGHNLRGPIANIRSITDIIRESEPEDIPVWLDKQQQTEDGLLSTLNDLLNYAQVKMTGAIAYEDCDIEAICKEVLLQVADDDIQMGYSVTYKLSQPTISYSKIYLQSILYNLLSNSFKYRRTDIPLAITISIDIKDEHTRLMVSDNGTGFDMEKNKDKLFKLNSTFHKGYNSKGIGMFITKTQIEKLGGTISANSKPNEGTTFIITF